MYLSAMLQKYEQGIEVYNFNVLTNTITDILLVQSWKIFKERMYKFALDFLY